MTTFGAAELKALLAKHGQTLRPDATVQHMPKPTGAAKLLVLDRVVEGVLPAYCTHGYATCVACEELLWIGHATGQVLQRGDTYPICQPCAARSVPAGEQPVDRIVDHLRADGPHE